MPADALSRVFSALADPTRHDMVARLAVADATVNELAQPYEHVRSAAAIDTEVAKEPQYADVPERLGLKKAA